MFMTSWENAINRYNRKKLINMIIISLIISILGGVIVKLLFFS